MELVNKADAMAKEMGMLRVLESKEYAKIWNQIEILNEILAETDPYPIKNLTQTMYDDLKNRQLL